MPAIEQARACALWRLSVLPFLALALFFLPSGQRASGGALIAPNFVRGTLNLTIDSPTSIAFGPDGRLYAAHVPGGSSTNSQIIAYTLDPATKAVLGTEVIASSLDDVMSLAFDPTAPPSPVTVYASRRERSGTDGLESRISAFTSPAWTRSDIITGLPTSRPNFNHLTNGLAFDATGRLLIAQGSATDAGLRGPLANDWAESPLSAAILIADVGAPGFDGAITYTPPGPPTTDTIDKTGGDVDVFAPGLRNPFDLVVHSNGNVYATDNGPSGSEFSATCSTAGSGTSPSDELNRVAQGNYYGHPNRNRGRTDARQCTYHPPEQGSGAGFTGPIAVLPAHCSCDGIAEYTNAAFGGAMQGDLLYVGFSTGQVYRAKLSGDGSSVLANTTLAGSFIQPLDVTVGPDGTIYIAEFGGGTISYLAPDTDRDGCADSRELGGEAAFGGRRDPNSFWDFFDTPDASNGRDHVVSVGDVFREVTRFGSSGNPAIDPLSPPPPSGYHTAFDRRPPLPGGDPWDLQAPDGSITVGDIFFAVNQFGHSCVSNG